MSRPAPASIVTYFRDLTDPRRQPAIITPEESPGRYNVADGWPGGLQTARPEAYGRSADSKRALLIAAPARTTC